MNLYKNFKSWLEEILDIKDIVLEKPRAREHGHFSTPVALSIAKKEGKSPREVAEDLKEKIFKSKFQNYKKLPFEIEIAGPGFLNFKFHPDIFIDEIKLYLENDGVRFELISELVMIEYLSPNTNKSLHIGHLRNLSLGFSIGKILEKIGYKIHFTEIVNNRGIAICKAMLMYKLFGEDDDPQKSGIKGDEFLGKYYVMYEKMFVDDPTLEEKANQMLLDWENGEKKTIDLWKKLLNWYYEGYNETVENEYIHFDSHYYESDIYKDGAKLVYKLLDEGKVYKETEGELSGTIVADLTSVGLDKKILIRSNGTAIYMTQDLVLADIRDKEYRPTKMIYVVGKEQEYHFQVLFEMFKIIGYGFSRNCHHLSYGLVRGKEGKFSSRKGNVVTVDGIRILLEELISKIIDESETSDLTEKEKEEIIPKIALAARRYEMLKYDASSEFIFDPLEISKLEGNTGPYLLYTYARIKGILRKLGKENFDVFSEIQNFEQSELNLLSKLNDFKEVINKSADEYKPHFICTYLYELCQDFNSFYAACHVSNEKDESKKNFRIFLLIATSNVIKEGLELLGIETVEKM